MKCTVCEKEIEKGIFCCEKCRQRYYYEKNKEQRKQYKKEYYQSHKGEYADRKLKWIGEHREKWNEYCKIKNKERRNRNESEI